MIEKRNDNTAAIIVLHEIYGINPSIEAICSDYHAMGFDVFCPDMLKRSHFEYEETSEAYRYFMDHVGFDFHKNVKRLAKQLKGQYEEVFLIGFSVGATIAWKCCESTVCDGIVCCYGSRIRDYLEVEPKCPTLMVFAEWDSFNVVELIKELRGKAGVIIRRVEAHHGFMDKYSKPYDQEKDKVARGYIEKFLEAIRF